MHKTLHQQLYSLIKQPTVTPSVAKQYQLRLKDRRLTRDENPASHFCVYFAAIDPVQKKVLIGHHKKANLWLFTGGHIDQRETIKEAVSREIWEEWGQKIAPVDIPQPSLLTITRWMKSTSCKTHFDIWHFFPVEKEQFIVDQSKIHEEFHEIGWIPVEGIARLVSDPATLNALKFVTKFDKIEY